MAEIPEHLLKRAAGPEGRARVRAGRYRRRWRGPAGEEKAAEGAAVAHRRAPGAGCSCNEGRRAARRSRGPHPAPAHRRQGRLDPGREGHADRQGPRLAPPPRRRVRRLAGDDRVPARVLGVRQRATPAGGELQPHAEPVEGAVVLPRPAGTPDDVPPARRRRGHPRVSASPGSRSPATSTATRRTSPRTASSPSRP